MLGLAEEWNAGWAGSAPRARAPRRNDGLAYDDDDDDDNGERELRSAAADAARLRDGWAVAGGETEGGKEEREGRWKV